MLGRRSFLALSNAALLSGTAFAGERPAGAPSFASRSAVMAPRGAVSSSHPLATEAGIAILRDGGSAADAALAAVICLSVLEPMMSGPGGDLFAILWDPAGKKLEGLASAGAAPRALTRERVLTAGASHSMPKYGALSVTIPGAVAGWAALHQRFGRMPWKSLFDRAIGYAENGFPVSPIIAWQWQCADWFKAGPAISGDFGELRRVYMPGGTPPRAGSRFANPDLARSLAMIADHGADACSSGALATAIARSLTKAGLPFDVAELAEHRAEWTNTIGTTYRGYDVRQMPLPGQGLAVLQILNILEGFDLKASGFGTAESARAMIEATRAAFQDRSRLYGDPAFSAIDTGRLLSKDYAAAQRARLPLPHAPVPVPLERGDTTLVTAADASGQMISLITSLSGGFGSGLVVPGTGITLQNRANGFSLQDGHPNCVAPRKRPLHTIIPAFVMKDGHPWLAFGVMGGAMQPQGQAQILSNIIDHGLGLQEAGDAPRLRLVGDPASPRPRIQMERDWSPGTITALRRLGYDIAVGAHDPEIGFGGYQAVSRNIETGYLTAATEMRQDGQASGF